MKSHTMKKSELVKSVGIARKNWRDWQDVFEHRGPISENPILACPDKFRRFCKEYSVHRTIRHGTHDKFRLELKSSRQFKNAVMDGSGGKLVRLERKLRKRFGTLGGRRGMVSVLSKIAAFVRPDRFVAWDNYAKKGLNRTLDRSVSSPFPTYADYLKEIDRVWRGYLGRDIKAHMKKSRVWSAVENKAHFQRRVLDVYLMKCGDRDF